MKQIPLTRGHVALVSDCDYAYLKQWVWHSAGKRTQPYAQASDNTYMHTLVARRKGLIAKRVDHANRNTLDNRRRNLRDASRAQNAWNKGPQRNNTSGFKNVSRDKQTGRYEARVQRHGKQVWLGRHKTRKAAWQRVYEFIAAHDGDFGCI